MTMKNFYQTIKFALIFLWIMGFIGGAGYAIYCEAYVIAVAVVVNSLIAFPMVRQWWKELMM